MKSKKISIQLKTPKDVGHLCLVLNSLSSPYKITDGNTYLDIASLISLCTLDLSRSIELQIDNVESKDEKILSDLEEYYTRTE